MIKNRNLANEARRRSVQVQAATIAAAAGNTVMYLLAPCAGTLEKALFSATDTLAVAATNHATFFVTNITNSSAAMLHATVNTTDSAVTGASAITANTLKTLTLSDVKVKGQFTARDVAAGDRIEVKVTVAGTLANAVTFPVFCLQFIDKSTS